MATTTDVLIIGSGPTGLMLALELSMQKIPFRILDSTAIRSDKSRALVLHSRTLELLARHGIVQHFIERGRFNSGVRIFANGKFVFEIDLLDLGFDDTEFPTPLMISQAETERLLDEVLAEFGVVVERPVTVESIVQEGEKVTAILRKSDGSSEEVACKYLVGCDGAHSFVRKSAKLEFQGGTYPEDLILADVHLKWSEKELLSVFIGNCGFMALFPMKDGVYRVVCSRPTHLNDENEPTIEDFEESFRQLCPSPVEVRDPLWMTRFRLHHRNVHDYRKGRIFVCGDAAHIHSPAGGQGMNTGMQDAVNLSWKLAMVLRGEKPGAFLDSYSIERHRVGENLLKGTDKMFELITTTNWIYLWLRNNILPWIVPWVMASRERRAHRFRFISQLGVRYRHSPIVGTGSNYRGKLRGGDRAPNGKLIHAEQETSLHGLFVGTAHHLVLFSGVGATDGKEVDDAAAEIKKEKIDWMEVHEVFNGTAPCHACLVDPEAELHNLFGFQHAGYCLVRPDGYIAHIGPLSQMGSLETWLKS